MRQRGPVLIPKGVSHWGTPASKSAGWGGIQAPQPKPGRDNAFLLQKFARYYLAKKPSKAHSQELETKAELLQSGEPGTLPGRWKSQGRLEPSP